MRRQPDRILLNPLTKASLPTAHHELFLQKSTSDSIERIFAIIYRLQECFLVVGHLYYLSIKLYSVYQLKHIVSVNGLLLFSTYFVYSDFRSVFYWLLISVFIESVHQLDNMVSIDGLLLFSLDCLPALQFSSCKEDLWVRPSILKKTKPRNVQKS